LLLARSLLTRRRHWRNRRRVRRLASGRTIYNYFRDFDPQTGRYIESDPVGLRGGLNTYAYVSSAPTTLIDPWGLSEIPPSGIPGGPWEKSPDNVPDKWQGPKQPQGGRSICQYVPPESQGGPSGSKGYWKYKRPNAKWQRFSGEGSPITPEQAHPGRGKPPTQSALPWVYNPIAVGFFLLMYSEPVY
jgi:RHS repeat-associated protein